MTPVLMKIKNIRLERFRQFSDTAVAVGDFNVLVGPNNCGKTTILHAIRAFFLLMHGHVRFEGDPPTAGCRKLSSDRRVGQGARGSHGDKWFDSLDLSSLDVVQRVFPGKELLKKSIADLNSETPAITRGHLIASISPDLVAKDMRDFITTEAAAAGA